VTRIPGSREVDRLMRRVLDALKAVIKQSNQRAAKHIARGNYAGAQAIVEAARKVPALRGRLKDFREEWRTISVANNSAGDAKAARTPLWGYYKMILTVLADLGGEATLAQLYSHLTPQADALFKEGDLRPDAKGTVRWQVMVRRARRAMVQEGWIEAKPSNRWHLTEEGKRAATGNKAS
jgi:hypothetical protein